MGLDFKKYPLLSKKSTITGVFTAGFSALTK
jgi:hypothetical protein